MLLYTYDKYGRVITIKQHIDATITDPVFKFHYDSFGNVDSLTYPGNVLIKRQYDNYGNLIKVMDSNNTMIWQLTSATGLSFKYTLGNGQITEKTLDSNGFLQSIVTSKGSIFTQNLAFVFDPLNGNLKSRQDKCYTNTLENFQYDDLNRLQTATVNGQTPISITYSPDASGNLDVKSDIGNYKYNSTKPHAVTDITNQTPVISGASQTITYSDFNKVQSITEANNNLTFVYGPDQERRKSVLNQNGVLSRTNYYVGLYEKTMISGGATKENYYVQGGDGIAAVLIKINGNSGELNYVHKDHLGSIVSITDANGTIKESYNYDPWGRRRNPTDWSYTNVAIPTILTRGFTGHEHMEEFKLINMNGRVYDPALGRFLSADNNISDLSSSQSYNRYSYCDNNPLIYTDPSGWQKLSDFLEQASNSQYGGYWESDGGCDGGGSGHSYSSNDEAYQGAQDYNNEHDSWANTAHGSSAGCALAYYNLVGGNTNLKAMSIPGSNSGIRYVLSWTAPIEYFNKFFAYISNGGNNASSNQGEYLVYNGNKLNWYDSSGNVIQSYNATSGLPGHQNSGDQQTPDAGPIPEGRYSVNLKLNPDRVAKVNLDNGKLWDGDGIQKIPYRSVTTNGLVWGYAGWGTMRAKLNPVSGNTYGRNGFYLHDSHKGFSHGCIEVSANFFSRLIAYSHLNGSIILIVKYPTSNTSTYGGTYFP